MWYVLCPLLESIVLRNYGCSLRKLIQRDKLEGENCIFDNTTNTTINTTTNNNDITYQTKRFHTDVEHCSQDALRSWPGVAHALAVGFSNSALDLALVEALVSRANTHRTDP